MTIADVLDRAADIVEENEQTSIYSAIQLARAALADEVPGCWLPDADRVRWALQDRIGYGDLLYWQNGTPSEVVVRALRDKEASS